jgi:hypothetical protein
MDRRLSEWKFELERIWSAAAPDWQEAARLVTAMASGDGETILQQAAAQALPILRNASHDDADQATRQAARRRLGVICDVLETLTTPRFGRRETGAKRLTPEERYRQMLGLPLDGSLSAPQIHQAWKRAARTAHPDAGGNAREFQALSTARDALIREVRLVRSL